MEQQMETNLAQAGWKIAKKKFTEVAQANLSPENLISVALQNGRSMQEIGILIQYRNDEIARIAKLDFYAAKKEFLKLRKRVIKNNSADFGTNREGKMGAKYKFENLDDIDEAVREACAEVGLSWDWETRYEGDWIYIRCVLSHTSGHSKSDEMRGKMDNSGNKNDMQADASTVSYLRRYTLKAVLGLSSGKDDNDGHKVKQTPDEVNILKAPSAEKFQEILKALIRGKATLDELQARNHFTADQLKAIADLNLPAND